METAAAWLLGRVRASGTAGVVALTASAYSVQLRVSEVSCGVWGTVLRGNCQETW
jgi:hypothetical protein